MTLAQTFWIVIPLWVIVYLLVAILGAVHKLVTTITLVRKEISDVGKGD